MRDRARSRPVAVLCVLAVAAAATVVGGAAAQSPANGPPSTSIASGPSGTTTDTSPTFTFSSSEPDSSFECRIAREGDPGEWRPCASPYSARLADGSYVFAVRAIDAAGNVDPTPATRAFAVDSGGVDTFIDAGPSGATRDTTPSFTFGTSVAGATFECRIDGPGSPLPAFSACSAPLVTPRLASGAYVLRVRARSPGGAVDSTPAARAFAVDADAPETTIVAGPAEGAEVATKRPAFRYASEPGASFACRLDNREAKGVDTVDWAPCPPEGYTTLELEGGKHTFEVRATDAVGNPDATPARRTFRVSVCQPVVRFELVEAESDCLKNVGTQDLPRWESEGDVKLNGLLLPAPGPVKVVLQGPTPESPGGKLGLGDINLAIPGTGVTLWRGSLNWDLPKGGPGDEKELKTIDLSQASKSLFGMKVAGNAALRLGRRAPGQGEEYYGVLALHLALPDVFKAGPSPGSGGVTGDVAIRMDKRGVDLDGLKVDVRDAYVGGLGVKSVCFSFVRAGGTVVAPCEAPRIGNGTPQPFIQCRSDNELDRWDGAAAIVFPTPSSTQLGLWGGLRGGRLSHAGAFVDDLGTLVPLVPGVFLQKVALGVCLEPPPFQVKGEAGISFGPTVDGRQAVRIDGSFHYIDAYQGQPWSITARGDLAFFGYKLAYAYLKYQSSGTMDFGFQADLRFGPATIKGGVNGWLEVPTATARAGAAARSAKVLVPMPGEGGSGQGGQGGGSGEGGQGGQGGQGSDSGPAPLEPPPPSPGKRFNVVGGVEVCIDSLACAAGRAVISSVGAAGCITLTIANVPWLKWVGPAPWDFKFVTIPVTITGGAGYKWGAPLPEPMIGSCSIGPYEQARPARAAQGGAPLTIRIDGAQPAAALTIRGLGRPPRFTLVGPDGRRIASPQRPGGAMVPGRYMIGENPGTDTTTVVIAQPAGGLWTVEAQEGSAPITALQKAEARPEPRVEAGVTGRGYRRFLSYVYVPRPGEQITFIERGPMTQQTLGAARAGRCPQPIGNRLAGNPVRCGLIRFPPGDGPAGRRQILALVTQDGLPRKTMTVASYRAPRPARPGKPRRLSLRWRGKALIVRWRSTGNTFRSNIVVRDGDGRRMLVVRPAFARATRVRGVSRRRGLRVTVRGMRLDGIEGRPATARLKPPKRARPKPRGKRPGGKKSPRRNGR